MPHDETAEEFGISRVQESRGNARDIAVDEGPQRLIADEDVDQGEILGVHTYGRKVHHDAAAVRAVVGVLKAVYGDAFGL